MADHLKEYQFERGQPKTPGSGRKIGTRNKLSERFLNDFLAEWEKSGPDAIKILAKEDPATFAKLALGILPKEFGGDIGGTVHHIITGVPRHADGATTPTFQAPPAMLPEPSPTNFVLEGDAPKEPSPAELKRAEALKGVEPKWDAATIGPAEVRRSEPPSADTKLYYPPVVPRIGWR